MSNIWVSISGLCELATQAVGTTHSPTYPDNLATHPRLKDMCLFIINNNSNLKPGTLGATYKYLMSKLGESSRDSYLRLYNAFFFFFFTIF